MTEKALKKLSKETRHTLETIADVMYAMRTNCDNLNLDYTVRMKQFDEYKFKIRGYLEALVDMNIITISESRCLFLYYSDIRIPFGD